MDKNEIAARLRALRTGKNIKQSVLCKYLGTAKAVISKYENGLSVPSYDVLIAYARYFKVSTDYLLGVRMEKKVDVSGLTEGQISAIYNVIEEFHRANHSAR